MTNRERFLEQLHAAFRTGNFSKLSLGGKKDFGSELDNVFSKPVLIKDKQQVAFTFRYPTRDEAKNFEPEAAITSVATLLDREFFNADLFLPSATIYFSVDKNGKEKLRTKQAANIIQPSSQHDRQKQRLVDVKAGYLHALGITTSNGAVKSDMQHKFRQIDRYVGIMAGVFKDRSKESELRICDMGSGKGYLSFALYDHLTSSGFDVRLTGVEQRADLVAKCNNVALASGFEKLNFVKGSIAEHELSPGETLIALHACDTATDDAIAKGIRAESEYIICAPCCHKQVRRDMKPGNALQNITQHGILLERQAELLTDTIRALMLEAKGYDTRVFDFIEEADTPKNVMIAAVFGTPSETRTKKNAEKMQDLKTLFGLPKHYLEKQVNL